MACSRISKANRDCPSPVGRARHNLRLWLQPSSPNPRWARAAALTLQMIYQQPVRYEYDRIAAPTLLIVGAEDHVVPLGNYAQPDDLARLGDFTSSGGPRRPRAPSPQRPGALSR